MQSILRDFLLSFCPAKILRGYQQYPAAMLETVAMRRRMRILVNAKIGLSFLPIRVTIQN
jgi:hypothetical protein